MIPVVPDEVIHTRAISSNKNEHPAKLRIWYEDADSANQVTLRLECMGLQFKATAETAWDALTDLRKELDRKQILIYLYGASRNVTPSGMCLDMGVGNMAYRLHFGQPGKQADLVNILDFGEDIIPSSVDDQAEY